nr:Histone deacetylase complex subunit SAP30/SAP30-like [Ipomoea batatas]
MFIDGKFSTCVLKVLLVQKVDLSKLEMTALWRYLQHFNLVDAIPNPSKEQLIDVVQRHFMSQQLDELQVIVGFVQAAKRLKTVCK